MEENSTAVESGSSYFTDKHLELLERQLAERVTERVRKSLFGVYAVAGLAVIGVLGLIGYNILSVIENKTNAAAESFASELNSLNIRAEEIPAEVTDKIMDDLKEQNDEIVASTAETRASARRTRKLIQDVENALDNFEPQVQNMDENLQKIADLEVTAKNVEASFSNIDSLVTDVKSIADQISALAQQVDQINSEISNPTGGTTATSGSQSYEQRGDSIKSVIQQSTDTYNKLSNYSDSTTLFIQFAGSTRIQIQEVSDALKEMNYKIPGEERTVAAIGEHEVRYFHNEDSSAASKLADDINKLLKELGYNIDSPNAVEAKSLVKFSGKKPQAGVIELWLELPKR